MPQSSLYTVIHKLFYTAKFKTSSYYNNCVPQTRPQGLVNVFKKTQLKLNLLHNINYTKFKILIYKETKRMKEHI